MKAFRRLPLITFLCILAACNEFKTATTGPEDEIVVFADDDSWASLEGDVRKTFEDTVFTPRPELSYSLRRVPFAEYSDHEKSAFRIVLAPLGGKGPVARFVSESLDSMERQFAVDGKEYVINRYEPTARGQLLMFLAGPDLPFLKGVLESKSRELLSYFREMTLRRDLENLYFERKSENREIERSLLDRFQWTMSVPDDYSVSVDSANGRFFRMSSGNPVDVERWIFVSWFDVARPETITEQFVFDTRNFLTRQFLQGREQAEINPSHLMVQKADFLRRSAYEMRGTWVAENKREGAFVNYTFFDEKSRRIYMLDASIFAGNVEKKKMIRRLDAILHTFQTANEVTEDDRRDMEY